MQDITVTEKFMALSVRPGVDLKEALVQSGLGDRLNQALGQKNAVSIPADSSCITIYRLGLDNLPVGYGFGEVGYETTELVIDSVRKDVPPYYRRWPESRERTLRNFRLLNAALK